MTTKIFTFLYKEKILNKLWYFYISPFHYILMFLLFFSHPPFSKYFVWNLSEILAVLALVHLQKWCHQSQDGSEQHACFLSHSDPLVKVFGRSITPGMHRQTEQFLAALGLLCVHWIAVLCLCSNTHAVPQKQCAHPMSFLWQSGRGWESPMAQRGLLLSSGQFVQITPCSNIWRIRPRMLGEKWVSFGLRLSTGCSVCNLQVSKLFSRLVHFNTHDKLFRIINVSIDDCKQRNAFSWAISWHCRLIPQLISHLSFEAMEKVLISFAVS